VTLSSVAACSKRADKLIGVAVQPSFMGSSVSEGSGWRGHVLWERPVSHLTQVHTAKCGRLIWCGRKQISGPRAALNVGSSGVKQQL
jgi:hypothetical protein